MGEFLDKAKGEANSLAGKAKQAVADHTNNPELKAEGMAQEAKGGIQKLKGRVEGALGVTCPPLPPSI